MDNENDADDDAGDRADSADTGGGDPALTRVVYECPCYHTTNRGPTFVFAATVPVQEADLAKWVLAGVVLVMDIGI